MVETTKTIDDMVKEIKARQEELDVEINALMKVRKRMEKLELEEQNKK